MPSAWACSFSAAPSSSGSSMFRFIQRISLFLQDRVYRTVCHASLLIGGSTCDKRTRVVIYGIYYALAMIAGAALVTYLTSWPFAVPFYILAAFCLYFFRDPDRQVPSGPVAVSPADGKVVAVKPDGAGGNRVSIFLNVFDVLLNPTPTC